MLVAAAVGGAAAVLGAVAHFWDEERVIRRAARRLPESAAGLLGDGVRAKVVGRISLAGPGLAAPMSARTCVGYRIRFHAFHARQARVVEEEQTSDFLVRNHAAESVWVRVAGARVIYRSELEWHGGSVGVPDALGALLRRHGHPPKARYLLVEGVLAPDDVVTIVGGARREIDPTGLFARSLRDPPVHVVFESRVDAPLYIIAGR